MTTINGDVVAGDIQRVTDDDILVAGMIDDHSLVVLETTNGSITIQGKIDHHSNVVLKATGAVSMTMLDNNSSVSVAAGGDIILSDSIHNSIVDLSAHGNISLSQVDYGAWIRLLADGDVLIAGQINGNEIDHGPSRVEIVSNRGSVRIDGEIHGASSVTVTAGVDVIIGQQGGGQDVDGDSVLTVLAGRDIALGGGVSGGHTNVDLAAASEIAIARSIGGGATVRLLSSAGAISVAEGVDGASTQVTSWPVNPTPVLFSGGATPLPPPAAEPWAAVESLPLTVPRGGYWWRNWPQTFGYVAPFRLVPRSLEALVAAVIGAPGAAAPDQTPCKAVGGGWSFTDAALPFQHQADVDRASILKRGGWQRQGMRNVLEGMNDLYVRPMDLAPQSVARNIDFSTVYDQPTLRQVSQSGVELPASPIVRLIDTRSLASSLQCEFLEFRAAGDLAGGRPPVGEIMFHVEAGITIADLQQLLDHQKPRLALAASGGSPGSTLAGALSTATHGGEFTSPLLVDCVRAIHLVGPGGKQWWIEGDIPVADPAKLQLHYAQSGPIEFIGGSAWNGIPGLTAQDVLAAAAVSMGTLGVIYSVVLAVTPQFGLRQVVRPSSWGALLAKSNVSEADLRGGSPAANQAVLKTLLDGTANGTGIPAADNLYVDLAINPFRNTALDRDCWVVNRARTPSLPDDDNSPVAGLGDYMSALARALNHAAVDRYADSNFAGRIFDFLSWATDQFPDPINNLSQAGRLASFITRLADVSGGALAAASVQAVTNVINAPSHPDRGHEFLADVLTGFFHALEGTAVQRNSDRTAVSYKVGAIGWPDGGLPGRGLEVAMDAATAFSFLQTQLFDQVLDGFMTPENKPLFGYISVRICPRTRTLMGMQQFGRLSAMIEVVAFRSPEANEVMNLIQRKAIAWAPGGVRSMLHWGLENSQITASDLAGTPLGQPYKPGFTRMEAFRQVRQHLRNGQAPVFDNTFTARLGL